MQHGEEDGPLDVELEAASLEELLDDWRQPVCCQSRSKIRAGPMRRVVMVGSCPLA